MIRLTFTQEEIEQICYERFHHPDPIVMRRCETVYLHAKGFKIKAICEITELNIKTVRDHLHLYEQGGLEAIKTRNPYRPTSDLDNHRLSIEEEFRRQPPASLKEARERIRQITGIERSISSLEVFLKRIGMSYRKTGGLKNNTASKADLVIQEDFLKKSWNPR